MSDPTEKIRRSMVDSMNLIPVEAIKERAEKTWTTQQLQEEFEVLGFMAPYVVVRRKADGKRGSMLFKHSPRVYFDFKEE